MTPRWRQPVPRSQIANLIPTPPSPTSKEFHALRLQSSTHSGRGRARGARGLPRLRGLVVWAARASYSPPARLNSVPMTRWGGFGCRCGRKRAAAFSVLHTQADSWHCFRQACRWSTSMRFGCYTRVAGNCVSRLSPHTHRRYCRRAVPAGTRRPLLPQFSPNFSPPCHAVQFHKFGLISGIMLRLALLLSW